MQSCEIILDKLLCYQVGESRADKGTRAQYVLAAKEQATNKIQLVNEEESRRKAENPYIREVDMKELATVLKKWMISEDRKNLYKLTLNPDTEDKVTEEIVE